MTFRGLDHDPHVIEALARGIARAGKAGSLIWPERLSQLSQYMRRRLRFAAWKGDWIRREGLRGSMFWELSGDKGAPRDGMEAGHGKDPQPGQSLIAIVNDAMGELDRSSNWLQYEGSQYDNMRAGMP